MALAWLEDIVARIASTSLPADAHDMALRRAWLGCECEIDTVVAQARMSA